MILAKNIRTSLSHFIVLPQEEHLVADAQNYFSAQTAYVLRDRTLG